MRTFLAAAVAATLILPATATLAAADEVTPAATTSTAALGAATTPKGAPSADAASTASTVSRRAAQPAAVIPGKTPVKAPAKAANTTSTTTLTSLRTAAFALADRLAALAPRLPWRQKAANADYLASKMRLPNISVGERAIAIGKTQLGTQYRWGGTTPAGFDCSGFTGFAFAKAGKKLPRTAAMQQRAVRKVTSPRPGDLVFFGQRAWHVGIYVGNGYMLHSPRTGKPVQVAKIWSAANYGRV